MKLIDGMTEKFRVTDYWTDPSNVTWLATGKLDLRELSTFLTQAGARFITITAMELPRNEGFCLEYLWDMDGQLFGFAFYPAGRTLSSIYDLCEAADWIEREIHEEYDFEFTGRRYEPLLLREGEQPGVNLREVSQ